MTRAIAALFIIVLSVFYYHFILADHYYLKSVNYEKAKQWRPMILASQRGLYHNPYHKRLHSFAARAQLELKDYSGAKQNLEQVIRAYPFHLNAFINIGVAMAGLGEHADAIVFYKKALEILPNNKRARKNLANALFHAGRREESAAEFQKLIKVQATAENYYNLGIVYLKMERYEDAIEPLEKCIELNPGFMNARTLLAAVLMQISIEENNGKTTEKRN